MKIIFTMSKKIEIAKEIEGELTETEYKNLRQNIQVQYPDYMMGKVWGEDPETKQHQLVYKG